MPRFNNRGQVCAGVGDGVVSIDNIEVGRGGGACWYDDDRVIYGGHWEDKWALLVYDQRTGHTSKLSDCEATSLVGSGGEYFAVGSNGLAGSIPFTTTTRLTPTSTDGRGAADRAGHIATSDLTGTGFILSNQSYAAGIACYNLTVVGPNQAVWPGGSVGLPPITYAGPHGRVCYGLVGQRPWVVYYLVDVGLVAHPADDPAHMQIIEATPTFFHYDAIMMDEAVWVTYARTAAEAPGENVIRRLDLSIQSTPVPVPVPVPKEIPKVPTPTYTDNPTDTLKALRSHYPTPLGPEHTTFLIAACKVVGHGAGLLAKSGGTTVTLPTGQTVSQDWMVFPDGFGTDFLSDGEGAADVGWGQLQEYDRSRYVSVGAIITGEPEPKPIPTPQTPPGPSQVDLGPILAQLEVLSRDVADLASRIAQLEAKPDPVYEVRIGRSYGHSHSASIKKVG